MTKNEENNKKVNNGKEIQNYKKTNSSKTNNKNRYRSKGKNYSNLNKDNIKFSYEEEKKILENEKIEDLHSFDKLNSSSNKTNSLIKLRIWEFIGIIIIVLLLSILIGYKIGRKDTRQVVLDKNLQQFIDVYNNTKENYYKDIKSEDLISSAIEGMLKNLDDHSLYFDENSASTFNAKLSGEYEGIGIEIIAYSEKIIVYNVFKDSPADKAGIKVGDIITKIDDKVLEGKLASEISEYIKESNKESFEIEVKRGDEVLNFNLSVENITINTVSHKIYEKDDKKIGYIYIGIFSNNAYDQFKETLEYLEEENIDSLIIDVRDNTGGHLTTSISILSLFMNSDKVIYQIEKQGKTTKYYSTGKKNVDYPIVILQNSNSASASELLSIALKEQSNATIIGENSYGKGTVQELVTLSDGTEYKITTKKWLSPKGIWVDGSGIAPDIKVELDDNYYSNPTDENDNQLQAAIDYLSK